MDEINEIDHFNLWEHISVYVSEYPVIFDKGNKEYHRKDIKRNAWAAIGAKLEMKGDSVEKEWEKLRGRYTRLKREFKSKNVSGASAAALKKARQKLEEMNFFSWMESYIKPRQSRGTHIVVVKQEKTEQFLEDTAEISDLIDDDDDESSRNLGSDTESVSSVTGYNNEDVTIGIKRKLNSNSSKNAKPEIAKQEQRELDVLASIGEAAKACTMSLQNTTTRDEHDIFCELLSKKMRRLAEELSDDEMEDLQESLMATLRKAKKSRNSRKNDIPVRIVNNMLSSPTSQSGYANYMQAWKQYPMRGNAFTQQCKQCKNDA